jgi:hypothetical protein
LKSSRSAVAGVIVAAVAMTSATQTQERPATDSRTYEGSDSAPPLNQLVVYEREQFTYRSQGRPDPFRSLLVDADGGVRSTGLALRGVIHDSDTTRSLAILTEEGTDRRIQARVGEVIGSLRILGIYPDRVEIVIQELGVARRETLRMAAPEAGAER